jgi:hypothetical protein
VEVSPGTAQFKAGGVVFIGPQPELAMAPRGAVRTLRLALALAAVAAEGSAGEGGAEPREVSGPSGGVEKVRVTG